MLRTLTKMLRTLEQILRTLGSNLESTEVGGNDDRARAKDATEHGEGGTMSVKGAGPGGHEGTGRFRGRWKMLRTLWKC